MKRLFAVAIGVIMIVTAVGLFFWWIQGPSEEEVTSSSPTTEEDVEAVEDICPIEETDRHPVVPGGLSSWAEVLREVEKDPEFLHFLSGVTGLSLEEIQLLVKLEAEGYVYNVSIPKGSTILNSGKKDGNFFQKEGQLPEEREALVDLTGEPVILVSCGNPMRVVPQPTPDHAPDPQPDPEPVVVVKEPFLRTDNVLSVTQNSAILAGFVNPFGSTVKASFEYGKGSSLDRKSKVVAVSSREDIVIEVKNLQPDTKYSYRVVVEGAKGTFRGEIRTFMTDF